jgi:hypothetical protein
MEVVRRLRIISSMPIVCITVIISWGAIVCITVIISWVPIVCGHEQQSAARRCAIVRAARNARNADVGERRRLHERRIDLGT